jgi:RsiW-degrading membrane proteinase PrsW (M82 family)
MKTWRMIFLLSLIILFLTAAFIFTTPLRYPGYIFSWRLTLIFLSPLVVLLCLLAVLTRWPHSQFSKSLLLSALLFLGLSILGNMALPVLGVSLIALLGMSVASRQLPNASVRD